MPRGVADEFKLSEWEETVRRRRKEAEAAGLNRAEAMEFATNGCDVGLLRKLVRGKCSLELIRRIVL